MISDPYPLGMFHLMTAAQNAPLAMGQILYYLHDFCLWSYIAKVILDPGCSRKADEDFLLIGDMLVHIPLKTKCFCLPLSGQGGELVSGMDIKEVACNLEVDNALLFL